MNEEKVLVGIDDKVIELKGDELEAFELDRSNQRKLQDSLEKSVEAKSLARQSALAKLAKLGLTEEEIASL
jgi:hypothetical protein